MIGPGDTDLGSGRLFIGNGIPGSFAVDAGSSFDAGQLILARQGNGTAMVVIDGTNTIVGLRGDGNNNRFEVGSWGVGSAIVSGGALLDARVDPAACLQGTRYCNNFIGSSAGSDGTLTITGAGSRAEFLHDFVVADLTVFDNSALGTPGGSTRGTVNVLNGGTLVTDRGTVGRGPSGSSSLGTERSFATVTLDGVGSVWRVTGGSASDPRAAFVDLASHVNAWAVLNISNGARLKIDATPNFTNGINLTTNNGRSDVAVSGIGSGMDLNGGVLQVGRRLGTSSMAVTAGATVNDAYFVAVGRDGSNGSLVLDGAGTALTINRSGAANSPDAAFQGGLHVGRSGTGQLTVSNGARIDVVSTTEGNRARFIELGVGTASNGTLDITGAGSVVRVSVDSLVAGGGPAETQSAYVGVGAQGAGTLNITGGGKLLLESTVVSTDADRRSTVVNIGGAGDGTVGARGIALVSGTGSEIAVAGAERFVAIGRGPSSYGQLTLADGGKLSATTLNVGRMGGVGVLQMNAGRIELTGQFAPPAAAIISTGFGVGIGGGTGIVRMDNGSTVTMTNPGTGGMSVTLGGTFSSPGGDGSLTMAGASSLTIVAAPGLANVTVGRDGAGLARLSDNSRIDIGDGTFYVARKSGSDGTVIASSGSSINAGFVGVGRERLADGATVDGGTGTMVLNGATLHAQDVVIGTNGFLGGSAGSIMVRGTLTNYGIFSPGNSPGVFSVDGNYAAGAGSRMILEVQAEGAGYAIDKLYFSAGHSIDLAGTAVEFRFLGATDPTTFLASGAFDIDSFLRVGDATGSNPLGDAAFAAVSFSARADAYVFTSFDYTATGGAVFTAVPVPEPSTWALWLAGLVAVTWRARRRR
ncbi:MAG: PEP-CTERM sorting domain-containing protein [Pseudomonadota bacterium]|nr:PEP-CTERM sorting domain-containing protein [Pseudomonadota bacterium]